MMKKIGWIKISDKIDGGNIYDNMTMDALSGICDQDVIWIINNYKNKLINRTMQYLDLIRLKGKKDIWIRRIESTITLPYDKTKGKNLLIFYHIDSSVRPYPRINKFLEKLFYRGLKKVDLIVTISKYWRDHFMSRGYENVGLIYTAFSVEKFVFSEEEINQFKRRYGLEGKPIIYLGNCQKSKGVVEAYQALKGLDAFLVTSGEEEVKIPAMNLNLDYRDYLRLLKASSVVVTMSKFKEGWCRTAHEALLCKTPVIGSGLGGMKELLEGGGQIVCEDFSKLKENVEYVMNHPEIGEDGYIYANQEKFTLPYFKKEWIKLIEEMGVEIT